jgi:hypothetical protein
MSDEGPRECRVRNQHADEWKPVTGPLEWEEMVESVKVQWSVVDGKRSGIAVRNKANMEESIISTEYIRDIAKMV